MFPWNQATQVNPISDPSEFLKLLRANVKGNVNLKMLDIPKPNTIKYQYMTMTSKLYWPFQIILYEYYPLGIIFF